MSDAYHQLLDATIQNLERLQADGVRFISVSAEALTQLAKPVPRLAVPAPSPARKAPASTTSPVSSIRAYSLSSPSAASPQPSAQASPSPGAGVAVETEAKAWADLRQQVLSCTRCPNLVAARKNVVFGVGDIRARLMFVGEAPGADEDAQGEPFVGKAGQLLTKIIQTMGLSREKVYIANILKCRPDTPGQTFGNRKPTPAEMKTCISYLHAQIDLIKPEVLVALGATAVEGLLGKTVGISRLRGHWHSYRGIPLMPTFHPSFLLRSLNPMDKRHVWEDMLQVMEKLGMPVSEKQRKYFQKDAS